VKDIYSPLEIDEEWDDMAPVGAAGPVMGGEMSAETGTATAVAVKPEMSTDIEQPVESASSTLPPTTERGESTELPMPEAQSNVMPGSEMKPADVTADAGTNEGTMTDDAAYNAAEMAIGEDIKAMPGANTAQDETLNVSDTTSAPVVEAPAAAMATAEVAAEEDKTPESAAPAEMPEPAPVKVDVKAAEAEAPAETNSAAGATFTPEVEPEGGIRPDMVKEEVKPKEEPAKEDLPVSPADSNENSEEEKPKEEASEKPEIKKMMDNANEDMNKFEKESDEGDAGLMSSIERYIGGLESSLNTKKDRHEKLVGDTTKLQEEIDNDQARLDKAMQARDIMK